MDLDDILNDDRYDDERDVNSLELENQVSCIHDLSEQELLVKLERDNLSAYARQYINRADPLYELAKNIKPIDGFEDFLIHGQPRFVEYETTNGQWIQLTPEDYANALLLDDEYHGGNIRLLSCKSGMLDDGFAQQLSNILGVKVMAPTQTLWVNKDGEMFIADSAVLADLWDSGENVRQTGAWKIFTPQKENQKNE